MTNDLRSPSTHAHCMIKISTRIYSSQIPSVSGQHSLLLHILPTSYILADRPPKVIKRTYHRRFPDPRSTPSFILVAQFPAITLHTYSYDKSRDQQDEHMPRFMVIHILSDRYALIMKHEILI